MARTGAVAALIGALSLALAGCAVLPSVPAEWLTAGSERAGSEPVGSQPVGSVSTAGVDPPALTRTTELMPLLIAVTEVRGAALSVATVSLVSVDHVLIALTLSPTSPRAVIDGPLILGQVRVAPGADLHLTPPGQDQPGQVLLDITYQADAVPETRFRAAIAVWPEPVAIGAGARPAWRIVPAWRTVSAWRTGDGRPAEGRKIGGRKAGGAGTVDQRIGG